MRKLRLDCETYSEFDLVKGGPWAYSMHPSTEVLMVAWAIDNDPPQLWVPGDPLPWWVFELKAPSFLVTAWNDFFERCILGNVLKWPVPPPKFWADTAAKAAVLALPRRLGQCGEALGLPTNLAKDKRGTALISKFSKPRRSTKKGVVTLTRTFPFDDPEAFQEFKDYCIQDVISEREIDNSLPDLPPKSRALWELDRTINLRGVRFDVPKVHDAIVIREDAKAQIRQKSLEITNGELVNLNSPIQLMAYMKTLGLHLENTQSEYLNDVISEVCEKVGNEINEGDTEWLIVNVLSLRLSIAKTSLAKYDSLLKIMDGDRAYGLLRYHGASTGRWSGNLFQPQNLPRPSFKDTDNCISLFPLRDYKALNVIYGDALEALSSCLRGMVIPKDGFRFVVSDFSQIESRVLRWLAGASLETYHKGLDAYKVNAVDVFKVDYDLVSDYERLIGKVIELACGYQGGERAFQTFAKVYGVKIPSAQAKEFVGRWRTKNPKIVSFWYNVEATAVKAVESPGTVQKIRGVSFKVVGSGRLRFLMCKLPSGRAIAYHRPSLVDGKFGKKQIKYWGVDSMTKKYKELSTYGGKLVENITQAVACDRMAFSMPIAEKAGYEIDLTVHDELLTEVEKGRGSIEELNNIMKINPDWAEGLPIDADGYESERYRK